MNNNVAFYTIHQLDFFSVKSDDIRHPSDHFRPQKKYMKTMYAALCATHAGADVMGRRHQYQFGQGHLYPQRKEDVNT